MHLDYFGDTYDLAKRFLMQCLAPGEPWGIIPMFTDEWNPEQVAAFERLLGGKVLIPDCIKGTRRRQDVSTAGTWVGHVFIDPDTGIRSPDSTSSSTKLIRLTEIVREAREHSRNLILAFDQSYANAKLPAKTKAMKQKLAFLNADDVNGFGYLGQASFLILSCDPSAIQRARQNLLDAGVPDSRLIL